ncbi:MAG: hypothetical protein NUW22_12545 [Acidobacteria bacterium]|nr:hypothetical protein [Acidobacteriota bacterium]
MANAHIDVRGIPEVLWGVRREVARILRSVAGGEPAAVSARLREIADAFECGQPPKDQA